MPTTRRIWSELVPLPALIESAALPALADRGVELLAKVEPGEEHLAASLVARARALSLPIGLWPLLGDADGRWLHPGNAARFEAWIERLLARLEEDGLAPDTLAIDLEPPIAEVRAVIDGRLGAARRWLRRPLDDAPHKRIAARLRDASIRSIATAIPPALIEGRPGRGWRRALGTPLDAGWDVVSPMLYSSLFEGYSFGAVRRADARALLSRFAKMTVSAGFTSVSLGAVGVGALGDERRYRDPRELADDVSLARAAGIDDVALFNLGGVLARPPIEPWLEALCDTPAGEPAPATPRAHAIAGALWVTGLALDR